MSKQVLIQFSVDKELKEEVSEIYESLGMDLPTAFRIFMNKSKLVRGMPFDVVLPDEFQGKKLEITDENNQKIEKIDCLSSYDNLTQEQVEIVGLPETTNYVINSFSGKERVTTAIYRTANIKSTRVRLLVYSDREKKNIRKIMKENGASECSICEYYVWFSQLYRRNVHKRLPIGFFASEEDAKSVWMELLEACQNSEPEYDHIVLDNAQVFPKELILILSKVAKNITCFVESTEVMNGDYLECIDTINKVCSPDEN